MIYFQIGTYVVMMKHNWYYRQIMCLLSLSWSWKRSVDCGIKYSSLDFVSSFCGCHQLTVVVELFV